MKIPEGQPWHEDDDVRCLLDAVPVVDGKVNLTEEELLNLLARFWWIGKED